MYTNTKNLLLAKDSVGRAKPTIRDLPPPNHVYGKSAGADREGAGQVTNSWQYPTLSKSRNPGTDFMKLNKLSIKNKAVNSKDVYSFRQGMNVKKRKLSSRQGPASTYINTDFVYGIRNRPSTPIKNVVCNDYGDQAHFEILHKYEHIEDSKTRRDYTNVRPTHASQKLAESVKQQGTELYESKSLFKMKKFSHAKPKTNTYLKRPKSSIDLCHRPNAEDRSEIATQTDAGDLNNRA